MTHDIQYPSRKFIAAQALQGQRGWRRLTTVPSPGYRGNTPQIEDEEISRGLEWCAAEISHWGRQTGQSCGTTFKLEAAEFYHFLHQRVARVPILETSAKDATALLFSAISAATVLQVTREPWPEFSLQDLAKIMERTFGIEVQREDVIEEAIRELIPSLTAFLYHREAAGWVHSYLKRAAQAIGKMPRTLDA